MSDQSTRPIHGFGFNPTEAQHHFLVTLPPKREDESIYISEHFAWDDSDARRELHFSLGADESKMRVVLPRVKWEYIADAAKAEFNQRLRDQELPTGSWKTGQTPIARLMGKELVLLAWAIEDADPGRVPTAIRNWRGLAPEERWWLFTMTNAATGHAITGRNKGWRKAIRFALTENPVSSAPNVVSEPERDYGLFSNMRKREM